MQTDHTKTVSLSSAWSFFSVFSLDLPQSKLQLAFSYCKMSIVDEMSESDKYVKLKFVEFLELIARIAEMVFEGNEHMQL